MRNMEWNMEYDMKYKFLRAQELTKSSIFINVANSLSP